MDWLCHNFLKGGQNHFLATRHVTCNHIPGNRLKPKVEGACSHCSTTSQQAPGPRELKTVFPRVWMIYKRNAFMQDRYIIIIISINIMSYHVISYTDALYTHIFFDYHIYLDPRTIQCWINSVLDQFKWKASHHSGLSQLCQLRQKLDENTVCI